MKGECSMRTTTTTTTDHHLYTTRISLREVDRDQLTAWLNELLATAIDLQSQVKQAHWNVTGLQFYELHLLFDKIAESVGEHVDLIAERVTALGGRAYGTARIAANRSSLPEFPIHAEGPKAYLEAVAERLGGFANEVREKIKQAAQLGDDTSADVLTEISRGIEKRLWFVEAHLHD
jgi:starvation-inducible DNA-binding protein